MLALYGDKIDILVALNQVYTFIHKKALGIAALCVYF